MQMFLNEGSELNSLSKTCVNTQDCIKMSSFKKDIFLYFAGEKNHTALLDLFLNKGVETKCVLASILFIVKGNWFPSLRKGREFLHGVVNSQRAHFSNTF